jgi:hypothetical protein
VVVVLMMMTMMTMMLLLMMMMMMLMMLLMMMMMHMLTATTTIKMSGHNAQPQMPLAHQAPSPLYPSHFVPNVFSVSFCVNPIVPPHVMSPRNHGGNVERNTAEKRFHGDDYGDNDDDQEDCRCNLCAALAGRRDN